MAARLAIELPISMEYGKAKKVNKMGSLNNGSHVLHTIIGYTIPPTMASETASEIKKWLDLTDRIEGLESIAIDTQLSGVIIKQQILKMVT